jgi:hypothetical protein
MRQNYVRRAMRELNPHARISSATIFVSFWIRSSLLLADDGFASGQTQHPFPPTSDENKNSP